MELPLSTQYTQRKISASTTEFIAGELSRSKEIILEKQNSEI